MEKNTFHLSDNFINQYKDIKPPFGVLGEITYKTHYARPIYEEDRTEEWWETIQRVVDGTYSIQKWHCKRLKLPWNDHKAQKSAQEMYDLMFNMKFLPPGRGLWMMGTDYMWLRGAASLNNCSFISSKDLTIDFAEPFCFLMDMSMLGVGVGGDTKGAGKVKIREPRTTEEAFIVEDSREGWVELIRTCLNAYAGIGSFPSAIDVSKVRPYGVAIKGFGGTSSGSLPLLQLVQDIQDILNPLIGEFITSTAIADLFNAIGKCVVSGNVRRSAEILLGDIKDENFLNLKNPELNKEAIEKWRWASNNTVFAQIGSDYIKPVSFTQKNGEIGYFWLENARHYGRMCELRNDSDMLTEGINPCGEQNLESAELCTLVETFPAKHDSYQEYERTLKFAYLYAKTVTLMPTHNERTNAVMLRNRRIGTSQSGIIQSIQKHGLRNHFIWSDSGYKYLRALDKIYSRWLCIPESIKITSVKPSGTVSLLNGSTPGIHFPHSEYYWRTMRLDKGSEFFKQLQKAGYRTEEGEAFNTGIVYFPIKEEHFIKSKEDVSMWQQLELAAQMQAYWADNQVSVTITFKPEEVKDIKQALELYETRLKAVSFLPLLTDEQMKNAGYKHPPYQKITKEEYEEAISKIKQIELKNATETQGYDNKFCDGDSCLVK
jgi:adenosylcobalamin-dependent ribonucleoside-triphosphate reductase